MPKEDGAEEMAYVWSRSENKYMVVPSSLVPTDVVSFRGDQLPEDAVIENVYSNVSSVEEGATMRRKPSTPRHVDTTTYFTNPAETPQALSAMTETLAHPVLASLEPSAESLIFNRHLQRRLSDDMASSTESTLSRNGHGGYNTASVNGSVAHLVEDDLYADDCEWSFSSSRSNQESSTTSRRPHKKRGKKKSLIDKAKESFPLDHQKKQQSERSSDSMQPKQAAISASFQVPSMKTVAEKPKAGAIVGTVYYGSSPDASGKLVCNSCGTHLSGDWKFCRNCGHPWQ